MIPLEAFCSQKDGLHHTDLSQPFVRGGYRYYCNGRVAVRVPCDEMDTPHGKDVAKAFARLTEPNEPWPPVHVKAVRHGLRCHECNGSGNSPCECPDCRKGCHPCEYCGGKGHFVWWSSVLLGISIVNGAYAWMVGLLPGAKFLPVTEGGDRAAVHFRFDGGEGLIMPMSHACETNSAHCQIELAEQWFLKDPQSQKDLLA